MRIYYFKGEELETDSKFVRIRLDEVSMRQTSLESLFGLKTVVHNFSILVVGFLPTRASLFVPKVKLGEEVWGYIIIFLIIFLRSSLINLTYHFQDVAAALSSQNYFIFYKNYDENKFK